MLTTDCSHSQHTEHLTLFRVYLFEYMVHRLSPLNLSSYLVQSHTPLAACLLYTAL